MRKTYKYRIYPSREQKTLIEEWLNICRVLYNDCLTERRDAWQSCRKSINYYDQQNQLPEIKTFDDGLKRVHSQVIQDVLKRMDKSFKNFFKKVKKKEKAGYPRYKPRSRYNSFTYPQSGFEISEDGKKLILSKIGSINIKKHRDIPENAKIKTCTIERDLNRWYACFSVEIEVEDLDQNEGIRNEITNPIGIDLGINHLITFSDGSTIDNPRYLAKSEKRLKRDQRRLSRAKKRSNNRKKRIFELAKTHRKVRDQRADLLHKISHSLVDTFDLIIFEDLNVRGMLKNHHLAKSISDVSWSQLTNFVSYKAEEAGRRVEFVNPKNTSQECSNCGGIVRKSLNQRVHKCPFCGLVMDRDENAALNILKKGLSRVGQELSKVKPEDFSKRRVIQEAPSVRVG